ncbi:MAG: glycosyltransferase family 4 protein [Acholeplasmataceae bacterium]
MRIGIFTDAYLPHVSGVTTSIYMLVQGLRSKGHEVYIITTSVSSKKDIDDPYVIRLKGMIIPKKGLQAFRLVPFTAAHIKRIEALDLDIMHVHTEFSIGSVAVHLKDKHNLPMVFTVHTMYEEYLHYVSSFLNKFFRRPLMHYLKKLMTRFIKRAEITIAPTQKVLDLMKSYKIEGDYHIVPTGINLSKFESDKYTKEQVDDLKASIGIPNDKFVCLFIGRMSAEKSIDVLLDGFSKINHENAVFLLVGDGPHRHTLEEKAKTLKIQDKCYFTGMVDWEKIGLYYQLGDVFLNASVTETQGLTYIEALAASLPLLVKYDQCLEDVVKENDNGLFFRNNKELPVMLNMMIQFPDVKNKLKENARKSIEKYSQECYTNSALSLYEEAIKKNKA